MHENTEDLGNVLAGVSGGIGLSGAVASDCLAASEHSHVFEDSSIRI